MLQSLSGPDERRLERVGREASEREAYAEGYEAVP